MRLINQFIAIFFVLILVCITASSQENPSSAKGKLSGRVVDMNNLPIKYAFVFLHNTQGKSDVTVKLDEHGRFSLQPEVGLYDIFVTAEGFSPTCKRVEISEGHTTIYNARLKPDNEHLESNIELNKAGSRSR